MAVYACSDLHGCKKFYYAMKEYLKPEDKVYFLGDAGDRGPNPWETIKLIREDSQFTYLKGNHEDMLVNVMIDYLEGRGDSNLSLLGANGGIPTYEGWIADGADREWVYFLKNLPTCIKYTRPDGKEVLLSHAGYTPDPDGFIPKEESLIWDRIHLYDTWTLGFENTYIVHGHTPIPVCDAYGVMETSYDNDGNFEALNYCDGHKWNIDAGAFFTDEFILFNLDTFESIVFIA